MFPYMISLPIQAKQFFPGMADDATTRGLIRRTFQTPPTLLLLLLALTGCATTASLLEEASTSLAESACDPAIRFASEVIERDPANAEAFYIRGTCHLLHRGKDAALPDIRKSIELDRDRFVNKVLGNNEVQIYNATYFRHSYNPHLLNLAIELLPEKIELLVARGHAYEELGKPDLAKADYIAAFTRHPALTEAFRRSISYPMVHEHFRLQAAWRLKALVTAGQATAADYLKLGLGAIYTYQFARPDFDRALELEPVLARRYPYRMSSPPIGQVKERLEALLKDSGFDASGVEGILSYEYDGRGAEERTLRARREKQETGFQSGCTSGQFEACIALAEAILSGKLGGVDPRKASEARQRACTLGHLSSCQIAKDLLQRANDAEAYRALEKRCYQDRAPKTDPCYVEMARYMEKGGNIGQARNSYSSTCDDGHASGCMASARLYMTQSTGPKSDGFAIATNQYKRACTLGDVTGCQQFLRFGREGCEAGNILNCEEVGWVYEHGLGTPRNLAEAVVFYKRACAPSRKDGCKAAERVNASLRAIQLSKTAAKSDPSPYKTAPVPVPPKLKGPELRMVLFRRDIVLREIELAEEKIKQYSEVTVIKAREFKCSGGYSHTLCIQGQACYSSQMKQNCGTEEVEREYRPQGWERELPRWQGLLEKYQKELQAIDAKLEQAGVPVKK